MMAGNLLTTNQTGQTPEVKTVFNNDKQDDEGEVETFGQKKSEFKTTKDYEIYLQNEMKEALESIAGVQDVKVVIYVDASEKKYMKETKSPKNKSHKKPTRKAAKGRSKTHRLMNSSFWSKAVKKKDRSFRKRKSLVYEESS